MADIDEHYYATQFAEIRRRISLRDAAQRRRSRIVTLAGSTLAAVLLTGGALAVVQATDIEKTASVCFQAADTSASSIEVSAAPTEGVMGALPEMADRVTSAEIQCAASWRLGEFSRTDGRVPELFTCVLADGRLGVFPDEGDADCLTLRLAQP